MGKMKKILVLLVVALGIFGFAAGSFAQDVCTSCDKCVIGSLDCTCQGQGGTTTCGYFDFDTPIGSQTGYAALSRKGNCRVIFNICDCDNAGTSFVAGHRMGVRMTIMVNGLFGQNGAYWSQPATANVEFGMFALGTTACAATAYTTFFGAGSFYRVDSTGTATSSAIAAGDLSAATTGNACTIVKTSNAAATQLSTNQDQGYVITATDEANHLSRWLINIPEMRVSPCDMKANDVIQLKIEILDQSTGGLCADCQSVCECVVDIATMCPSLGATSTCVFPYFTSTTAPDDVTNYWWNGIAITNTSGTAGTATLTVTQQDGAKGAYTTPTIAAGSVWVAPLANIPFTPSTGTLGGKPCWISVSTTFPTVDGMGLMADTSTGESMGYLCRQ
jgi:hypothetical protein